MLIPTSCPVCGAVGPAPCLDCRRQLRRAPALAPPADVDSCVALLDYRDAGRELVARLKYRNARSALPFLADNMAALVEPDLVDRGLIDLVTWAPTTAARCRRRGFDQAQVLARAVARRLRLPCRALLRRCPGPAQTGRPLDERRGGPAFRSRRSAPPRVLLVDDVVTSGATVSAAARVLRTGGAREVHVLAAARTPPKGSSPGRTLARWVVAGKRSR